MRTTKHNRHPLRRLGHKILIGATVLAFAACGGETGNEQATAARDAAPPDPRTAIVVPATARAMLLEEMRVMLGSLNRFLTGASTGDTAMMRSAAASAGLAAAVDVNPEVSRLLPAEFLEIGEGTHVAFDSLAALVSQGAPQDVLLGRLSGILGRCVSCHSTYRLEVAP